MSALTGSLLPALPGLAGQVTAPTVDAPTIEYGAVAPMLVVFGAAVVGVLVEAFAPRRVRLVAQVSITLAGLLVAFGFVAAQAGERRVVAMGSIAVDGMALFLQGTILLLAAVSVLVMAERRLDGGNDAFAPAASALPGSGFERTLTQQRVLQTEVYPLTMFAVSGMLLFTAAQDLLTMFVALEVLSLPLYLLCGMARRKRLLSQEAALKYFLLGAFSSGFFLYGAALVYGFAGSVDLAAIDTAVSNQVGSEPLLLIGTGMLAVGLLFKVGAAPFHAWTPDVYQGAPTPITGFMAACTKIAAFGALVRVFYVGLGGIAADWQPMLWAVAIIAMLVGSVLALTQGDVKRMLAYSSVAHAGFVLVGVVAADDAGLSGVLFYLAVYGIATVGAFACVTLVRDPGGEVTRLSRWAGLGRRSPLVAGCFALFLLSFAGIPLTSGFVGKLAVFSASLASGGAVLVVVALLASAVAAGFYVRVIWVMFFSEPEAGGPAVAVPGTFTAVAVALTAAATLVLGIVPGPLLDLADQAGNLVR